MAERQESSSRQKLTDGLSSGDSASDISAVPVAVVVIVVVVVGEVCSIVSLAGYLSSIAVIRFGRVGSSSSLPSRKASVSNVIIDQKRLSLHERPILRASTSLLRSLAMQPGYKMQVNRLISRVTF